MRAAHHISLRQQFELVYGPLPSWLPASVDRASLFLDDDEPFVEWSEQRHRRNPVLAAALRRKAGEVEEMDAGIALVLHRAADRAATGAVASYVI